MIVYVHLAEGFEEIEALSVVDILRRGGVEVRTVSIAESRTVMGAHQILVEADLLFSEADYKNCEMIVLPGGMPGALNLKEHQGLSEQIRAFAREGKWLAAICAAPMVYGEMGLLEGRRAVCYPGMEEHLKGALPFDGPVACDGGFITSKGPATAAEFGLTLLELLQGKEIAVQVRKSMLF